MRVIWAFLTTLIVLGATGTVSAGGVTPTPPSAPDKATKYLFYMHGGYPEKHGGSGEYDYRSITQGFAAMGFHVVGEVRNQVRPRPYARQIAGQVQRLLDAGVPAANITVAGHSKGGLMTMMASTFIARDDVKYGVMAACGARGSQFYRGYKRFIRNMASDIRGRFLVAWDKSDDVAGNCDEALTAGGAKFRNKIFQTGQGHRLFYRPSDVWMKELAAFAKEN